MAEFYLILFFVLFIVGVIAFLVGRRTYNAMQEKESKHSKAWAIFASALTFLLISGLLAFFVLNFIYMER